MRIEALMVLAQKKTMAIPSAHEISAALSRPVRLKTWSLIVTVFGDAIMPRGGTVSAVNLNAVMEEMGINAGAVRTALSRLASEGIIERQRIGRASSYRLSKARELEFQEAALKIYAKPTKETEATDYVLVSSGNSGSGPPHGNAIRLSREWWLCDRSLGGTGFEDDHAVFEGRFTQLPKWLVDRAAPPETAEAMDRLIGLFGPLFSALKSGSRPTPIQALALRCLLIHAWRRIALRLRVLPDTLKPDDWPEQTCRFLVAELYGLLSVDAEKWLDDACQPACRFESRRFGQK